jgi:hypothetical protein
VDVLQLEAQDDQDRKNIRLLYTGLTRPDWDIVVRGPDCEFTIIAVGFVPFKNSPQDES